MTEIKVNLGDRGYSIYIKRGILYEAAKYLKLDRKVFIVTDSGVPYEYAEAVRDASKMAMIVTVPMGEGSKSPEVFTELCERMLGFGMTRRDCVVAVGGGVCGDLAGFAAASYMRGIDFYNVPTTVLSQVDSSVGGKVGINLGGVKNIVGAFHQPKAVLIDPNTLKTLPQRQISNGLAEAVKVAMTSDKELFSLIENEEITDDNIEKIITRSVMIKKQVVELDEREGGLRKILNFGHTFGHAVEAYEEMSGFYHGECVAIGMCAAVNDTLRKRLVAVLGKLGLPTKYTGDVKCALEFAEHDKKSDGENLSVILVDEIGKYRIVKMSMRGFTSMVTRAISILNSLSDGD